MDWTLKTARTQKPLSSEPYDRWVSPEGVCMAEFHRSGEGFLIRFPDQADFQLVRLAGAGEFEVVGWPAPQSDEATTTNLYHNAIEPILGNHRGGLFLHGSAVMIPGSTESDGAAGAIAFLGLSRGGKTTLAGSFAKAGYPFITEDVIDLRRHDGQYWLQPKRSKLRLFADSARFLLGQATAVEDDDVKQDVEAGETLPFADKAVPLRHIYVLGSDHDASLSVRQFSLQESLSKLMPHAFILDVEDRMRLQDHFSRLADLSQDVSCYALDFSRDYAELAKVRAAVLANFGAG